MGSQRKYNKSGGFTVKLYETINQYGTFTYNGISAKVVRKAGDESGHSALPTYTNTSQMYFKVGIDGDIIQGRYYDAARRSTIDFDWGHDHYNDPENGGDGRRFNKGVVHVQTYTTDQDGIPRRNYNARLMSNAEMKKFGNIIKHFNPTVKFRNRRKKVNKKG